MLFDDWDDIWRDASSASPYAGAPCARLRDGLEPARDCGFQPVTSPTMT